MMDIFSIKLDDIVGISLSNNQIKIVYLDDRIQRDIFSGLFHMALSKTLPADADIVLDSLPTDALLTSYGHNPIVDYEFISRILVR